METADVAHLPAANKEAQDQTEAGAGEGQRVADAKPEPEESVMMSSRPTISSEHLAPSSPVADLETDFPPGETE